MSGLSLVFALAVGLEKFTDLLKQFSTSIPFLPDKYRPAIIQLFTAVCGVVIAFGANLDLFKMANIHFSIPYVGFVAMGLVIGRGSNYAHDFFTNLGSGGLTVQGVADALVPTQPQVAVQPQPIQQVSPAPTPVVDVPIQPPVGGQG